MGSVLCEHLQGQRGKAEPSVSIGKGAYLSYNLMDVLVVGPRNKIHETHPGNLFFQSLIESRRFEYRNADGDSDFLDRGTGKRDKRMVVQEILCFITFPCGGKFLQPSMDRTTWTEVHPKKINKKIRQALNKKPELRQASCFEKQMIQQLYQLSSPLLRPTAGRSSTLSLSTLAEEFCEGAEEEETNLLSPFGHSTHPEMDADCESLPLSLNDYENEDDSVSTQMVRLSAENDADDEASDDLAMLPFGSMVASVANTKMSFETDSKSGATDSLSAQRAMNSTTIRTYSISSVSDGSITSRMNDSSIHSFAMSLDNSDDDPGQESRPRKLSGTFSGSHSTPLQIFVKENENAVKIEDIVFTIKCNKLDVEVVCDCLDKLEEEISRSTGANKGEKAPEERFTGTMEALNVAPSFVLEALWRHSSDALTQEKGCDVISGLCMVSEVFQSGIGAAGGVEHIIRVMRQFLPNERLQLKACEAMAQLASDDHLENQTRIGSSGGIECIIEAMKTFPKSLDVQRKAFNALTKLASNNHLVNKSKIGSSGGIDCIVHAMRRFSRQGDLQQTACKAISTVASKHVTNQTIVGMSGGIHCILQPFASFPKSWLFHLHAFRAMSALLSDRCAILQALFGKLGIECTIQGMHSFPRQRTIQRFGCRIVGALVSNGNVAHQTIASKCGGFDAIAAAMKQFSRDRMIQLYACQAIVNMSDLNIPNQTGLGNAGVIECIIKAMIQYPTDYDITCKACEALMTLSSNGHLRNRRKIRECGGYRQVVEAKNRFLSNVEMQRYAMRALDELDRVDETSMHFVYEQSWADVVRGKGVTTFPTKKRGDDTDRSHGSAIALDDLWSEVTDDPKQPIHRASTTG